MAWSPRPAASASPPCAAAVRASTPRALREMDPDDAQLGVADARWRRLAAGGRRPPPPASWHDITSFHWTRTDPAHLRSWGPLGCDVTPVVAMRARPCLLTLLSTYMQSLENSMQSRRFGELSGSAVVSDTTTATRTRMREAQSAAAA